MPRVARISMYWRQSRSPRHSPLYNAPRGRHNAARPQNCALLFHHGSPLRSGRRPTIRFGRHPRPDAARVGPALYPTCLNTYGDRSVRRQKPVAKQCPIYNPYTVVTRQEHRQQRTFAGRVVPQHFRHGVSRRPGPRALPRGPRDLSERSGFARFPCPLRRPTAMLRDRLLRQRHRVAGPRPKFDIIYAPVTKTVSRRPARREDVVVTRASNPLIPQRRREPANLAFYQAVDQTFRTAAGALPPPTGRLVRGPRHTECEVMGRAVSAAGDLRHGYQALSADNLPERFRRIHRRRVQPRKIFFRTSWTRGSTNWILPLAARVMDAAQADRHRGGLSGNNLSTRESCHGLGSGLRRRINVT